MAVKIRLQRKGRKQRPFYHIVVADARSPRDGRFIEKLGVYNPMTSPATIEIDRDRAYEWLLNGAQPTDTVRAILRFKGVLYKKHLQRGVQKDAITQEQADAKWNAWVSEKDAKIAARVAKTAEEKAAGHAAIAGTPPPPPPPPAPVVVEQVVEAATEAAEAVAEAAEEAVEVAAEAVETVVETAAEATAEEAAAEEAAPTEDEEKTEA